MGRTALSHNPATMSKFGPVNAKGMKQTMVPATSDWIGTGLLLIRILRITTTDMESGGHRYRGDSRDTGTGSGIR